MCVGISESGRGKRQEESISCCFIGDATGGSGAADAHVRLQSACAPERWMVLINIIK